MAVVDYNSQDWLNSDGLYVKFGTDQARMRRAGEYAEGFGGRHITEVVIDLLDLSTAATAASGNEVIVDDNATIPAGAFIEKIVVFVTEEPVGVNANLDLGLVARDRSTEIDFNGFLAAADAFHAGTDLGAEIEYVLGTTEAGALVGTVLATTGLITASADTADWTDGVLKIQIHWSIPLTADL